MYFDSFVISCLIDEFMDTIVGGRIQDIIDVDATGVGLEIYANSKRNYLYISADPQLPRCHIVQHKLRRGTAKPTQLALVLRRFVEGARIVHVSQPPYERLLRFDIEGRDGAYELIVEPMERRSNILLIQEGLILDCIRRVGPEDNRYRLSLPNHQYVLPPPQTKLDPALTDLSDIERILQEDTDPKKKIFRLIYPAYMGISPLIAKEIVFQATGDINTLAIHADAEGLFESLQACIRPLLQRQWQPGNMISERGVEAYSPIPLAFEGEWENTGSMSEALEAYYGLIVGADAYNEAKKPVLLAINEARARVQGKLSSLDAGLKDDAEKEILKRSGELILAYQYAIQKGETEFKAQYDLDQPELIITLDAKLSPVENANAYFDRYNKAKRAQSELPQIIEATRVEKNYLDQLEMDLKMASNWGEIDDVVQALHKLGYIRDKVKRVGGGGQSGPLRLVSKDGFVIFVGRNSRQNDLVTFKHANPQDLWLHARDVPGSHVIIRNDGRQIPDTLIEQAAALAAYYSSRQEESNVIVDMTRVKYVRKIKNAAPGMVTYRNETTLTVQPHNEELIKNG